MWTLWFTPNVELNLGGISEADFLRELSELVGDDKPTSSVSNKGLWSTSYTVNASWTLQSVPPYPGACGDAALRNPRSPHRNGALDDRRTRPQNTRLHRRTRPRRYAHGYPDADADHGSGGQDR